MNESEYSWAKLLGHLQKATESMFMSSLEVIGGRPLEDEVVAGLGLSTLDRTDCLSLSILCFLSILENINLAAAVRSKLTDTDEEGKGDYY